MNENFENNRIEKEALLDYVNSKIATYVVEPSIYKYAYENSEAFRNFINNTSDETNKYFNALKREKAVKNFRKGLFGVAAATTLLAPFAIASGVSSAIKIKKIKDTIGTPEFEEFFNFLAEKTYEGLLLDFVLTQSAYEMAAKIDNKQYED